jgi:translation initiation factor 2B subunit (eIF-2B alpha/beta/delta family)
MNKDSSQALHDLIREYLMTVGASRTTIEVLRSYIHAVTRLQCAPGRYATLIADLNTALRSTEPLVAPLVHLIDAFEAEIKPYLSGPIDLATEKTVDILTRALKCFEADTARLTVHCMGCIEPGDFVAVHGSTAYIREALTRAHTDLARSFRILVLKQNFPRTRELVRALEEHQIRHVVIPEYNLSHYLASLSKLFIGAVSVTTDHKAVTGPGTANVVSLCHAHGVPVYLFIESIKFAPGALPDQHIHKAARDAIEEDFTFHMTTFSHDIVDLVMVDHLITEDGEQAIVPTV